MKNVSHITCLILAYNEEHRIATALTHALSWADEVIVLDKGSTDRTREIAVGLGARVHALPFSLQGHERYEDMVAPASHDWVWHFTPGEVPTRSCIEAGRSALSDAVDLVYVPHHYFSFGVHSAASPWSLSYQPRLYRPSKVRFTGAAHNPIEVPKDRTTAIEYLPPGGPAGASGCYVLHQTHVGPADFIRSHTDYAINEAAQGTPEEALNRAIHQAKAYDATFRSDPALLGQWIAWKSYWHMVALFAWGRLHPDTRAQYAARASEMLAQQWPTSTPPPQ